MNFGRSVKTMLRCDTSELQIEQGRFTATPDNERICPCCDQNQVETSYHFIFQCSLYSDARKRLFSDIDDLTRHTDPFQLRRMDDNAKLAFLLGDGPEASVHDYVNLQWGRIETLFYHFLASAYKARRQHLRTMS